MCKVTDEEGKRILESKNYLYLPHVLDITVN
jgi:hypothetical protein